MKCKLDLVKGEVLHFDHPIDFVGKNRDILAKEIVPLFERLATTKHAKIAVKSTSQKNAIASSSKISGVARKRKRKRSEYSSIWKYLNVFGDRTIDSLNWLEIILDVKCVYIIISYDLFTLVCDELEIFKTRRKGDIEIVDDTYISRLSIICDEENILIDKIKNGISWSRK